MRAFWGFLVLLGWSLGSWGQACLQPAQFTLGFGAINCAAFSPDGRWLAIGGASSVHLIDTSTWEIIRTFEGHERGIYAVAFSPDGKLLASGSRDTTIRIWEIRTGRERYILKGGAGVVTCLSFSSDGKTVGVGFENGIIKLWDVETGLEKQTLRGHADAVLSLTFLLETSDLVKPFPGVLVASSSRDGSTRIWCVPESGMVWSSIVFYDETNLAVFSPTGRLCAVANRSQKITVFNLISGETVRVLQHAWVTALGFSPDGKTLVSATGSQIAQWDVTSGELIRTIPHPSEVKAIAYSPSGEVFVSGSSNGVLTVWKGTTGEQLRVYQDFGQIRVITISADGEILAAGTDAGKVLFWKMPQMIELVTIFARRAPINSLAFSPDRKILAVAGRNEVVLFDAIKNKEICVFTGESWRHILSVAFSSDGKYLAYGDEYGTVHLRMSVGSWCQFTWSALLCSNCGRCVVFSPDSPILAVAAGRVVRLFDLSSAREIRTLVAPEYLGTYALTYSPDGKILAQAMSRSIRLWNAVTGETIFVLTSDVRPLTIAFSPNGKILTVGLENGQIKLFDVVNGIELCTLYGHIGQVFSVVFSPDGKTLVSGSADGTIKFWNVERFVTDSQNGQESEQSPASLESSL